MTSLRWLWKPTTLRHQLWRLALIIVGVCVINWFMAGLFTRHSQLFDFGVECAWAAFGMVVSVAKVTIDVYRQMRRERLTRKPEEMGIHG